MLNDDHLRALGQLSVNAAAVEAMTRIVANDLIDDDPRVGKVLLASAPFSQVADRIIPLLELRAPSRRTTTWLQDAVTASKEAMQSRNTLLHSHWFDDDDGISQLRRKKGQPDFAQEVTLEDIEDAAHALKSAYTNLSIGWASLMIDLERTEDDPAETRPGFTTVPNRWLVEAPALPSSSRSKTATQRWIEGKISWDELEASGEQPKRDTRLN
jgi:hypothetical protein